ncbi:MAG TPA: hypothetical protein VGX28_03320 [Frankiaceae bacterium]|jgi:hypothetical protein|nr:hypothetical protein [Frankiaceae bacterium]
MAERPFLAWRQPSPVLPLVPPYGGLKDPCVVLHRGVWHLFATGCKDGFCYDVVHATAPRPEGPWTWLAPSVLDGGDGPSACAPGVVSDGDRLHLYLQQAYNELGGDITHLVSDDDGATFVSRGTALRSHAGTTEAGVYDAHPGEVGGTRYLVYAGFASVGEPDLHLARAATWDGVWERRGVILGHDDVPCHNPRGCDAYEWGLEGGQIAELPDGRTLLLGVCFLPDGEHGSRQRAILAVADHPEGPYDFLGPAIEPRAYGRPGENGHGCVVVHEGRVYLYFQHRDGEGSPWTLHVSSVPASAIPRETPLESVA